MNHLMEIAIIGVIIAFQTFAGYREKQVPGRLASACFHGRCGCLLIQRRSRF